MGIDAKTRYIKKWAESHISDGEGELGKPVVFAEFGLSDRIKGFRPSHRVSFYKAILDVVFRSARQGGAGGGAFIWQLIVGGMEEYKDEFGLVPQAASPIYKLLKEQSCRLAAVGHGKDSARAKVSEESS